MRCLKRNQQTVWYAPYTGETIQYDTDGCETGEPSVGYGTPVRMEANVSPAKGQSIVELFGDLQNYDRVIVTDDMSCSITETSVLWVDHEPDDNGDVPHDYIVRKIAKSLNSISIAISSVEVTP